MRAILACIAVLILIAVLVLGRESSIIMIAIVGVTAVAEVIVAAGQKEVTGGARGDAKSSAMFGRLREDKRAFERVRRFLNAAGHGFGVRDSTSGAVAHWPARLEEWLGDKILRTRRSLQ